MHLALRNATCRVLVVSLFALSLPTAQAGLIGADEAAAGTPQVERAMLLGALERADVVAQLQAAGVDVRSARERVRNMTDQEVHALAQEVQAAPAGGVSTWGWVAIALVAALVWYYAIRK